MFKVENMLVVVRKITFTSSSGVSITCVIKALLYCDLIMYEYNVSIAIRLNCRLYFNSPFIYHDVNDGEAIIILFHITAE